MSLPIKKLYLDSRYRRVDSQSTSNCKFELKQAVHLPLNCVAYIDDIQIPHSWYNVTDTNNKFYIRSVNTIGNSNNHDDDKKDKIITLQPKNYTLALLASDLNTLLSAAFGNELSCVAHERRGTIAFTSANGYNHRIFSDEELADNPQLRTVLLADAHPYWGRRDDPNDETSEATTTPVINYTNPYTANDLFRITGTTYYSHPGGTTETPFIHLRAHHNIYITSPNLGGFDTLGARGEQNILKKVPVSADFGYVIFDSVVSEHDYIDVSKGYFKSIELVLRDVRGNVIELNNAHWSLSIVFSMKKEKDI